MRGTLIVICGPTASGKTSLAIRLAKHFSAEIISADSRQVFKELKIGAAPPSAEELKEVKHHFVGSRNLDEDYNAGAFEKEALDLLEKLFLKNNYVVLAGGSGLYIDAVCNGFDKVPAAFPEVREQLTLLYEMEGIEALRKKLAELDPEYFGKVDTANPQRMMRALEVCIGTGMPYSSFRKGETNARDFDVVWIGLDVPRDELYKRIEKRVDEMMSAGLKEEAMGLIAKKQLNALQTVGYKELFDHLEGNAGLQETVAMIKQNTRRYAKRQLTWFRRKTNIRWFRPDEMSEMIRFIEKVR